MLKLMGHHKMKINGHPIFIMNPANYVEEIEKRFKAMQSIEDFAELLQFVYSQKIDTGKKRKKVIHLKINVLTYYGYVLKNGEGYTDFEISKKSGGKRKISTPKYVLKLIQKCLLELLSVIYHPHKAAHGFVIGKNVASNASIHVSKKFVFNIDIKDFFPSTSFHKIKFLLKIRPFFLKDEREKIAQLIANLCCKDGFLPQGAPTSPIITNIVCRRIDSKLSQLAFENKAKYSRYADDITFSCQENIFDDNFLEKIKAILSEDKYELNQEKTRISNWRQRQEVTGVVVNEKKNLPREYTKDIRYWLFTWRKFGEASTQADFEKRFPQKKGFNRYNGVTIQFKNYLFGKIQYLRMIRGEEDSMVQKFIEEYQKLDNKNRNMQKVIEQPTTINEMKLTEINAPLHNHIVNIRAALEIRGDFSIDYNFIKEQHWRTQLLSDNLKMENCGIRHLGDDGKLNNEIDSFYDFTKYACFQIELLLNIYFKKRFADFEEVEKEVERLRNRSKVDRRFQLGYFKKTVDSINLYSKMQVYAGLFDISRTSDLFKGIDAIREIRNLKPSHRPAFDVITTPIPPLTSASPYKEILVSNCKVEPIRQHLEIFVNHVKINLPSN